MARFLTATARGALLLGVASGVRLLTVVACGELQREEHRQQED